MMLGSPSPDSPRRSAGIIINYETPQPRRMRLPTLELMGISIIVGSAMLVILRGPSRGVHELETVGALIGCSGFAVGRLLHRSFTVAWIRWSMIAVVTSAAVTALVTIWSAGTDVLIADLLLYELGSQYMFQIWLIVALAIIFAALAALDEWILLRAAERN